MTDEHSDQDLARRVKNHGLGFGTIMILALMLMARIVPPKNPTFLASFGAGLALAGALHWLVGWSVQRRQLVVPGLNAREQIGDRLWGVAAGTAIALIMMVSRNYLQMGTPVTSDDWTFLPIMVVCVHSALWCFGLRLGWPQRLRLFRP